MHHFDLSVLPGVISSVYRSRPLSVAWQKYSQQVLCILIPLSTVEKIKNKLLLLTALIPHPQIGFSARWGLDRGSPGWLWKTNLLRWVAPPAGQAVQLLPLWSLHLAKYEALWQQPGQGELFHSWALHVEVVPSGFLPLTLQKQSERSEAGWRLVVVFIL